MVQDEFGKLLKSFEQLLVQKKNSNNHVFALLKVLARYEPIHTIKGTVDSVLYRHNVITALNDTSFTDRYNTFKNNRVLEFKDEIHKMPSTIQQYKENLYSIYSIHGLEYSEIFYLYFKVHEKDNISYFSCESPDTCSLILESFWKMLNDFEEDLKKYGINIILHRGWYWYSKGLLFLSIGDGEQAYYCFQNSIREDKRTNPNLRRSIATDTLEKLREAVVNKMNKITPIQNNEIEFNSIDNVRNHQNYQERVDYMISISFGLGHVSQNANKLNPHNQEYLFRTLFVIFESTLREFIEKYNDNEDIVIQTGRAQNFTWLNMGYILPKSIYWNAVSSSGNPVPQIYSDLTYTTTNTRDVPPLDQLNLITDLLENYPSSFTPEYAIDLIYLCRNVFLHNFVLISTFDQNQIRQILRQLWEFIILVHDKFQ